MAGSGCGALCYLSCLPELCLSHGHSTATWAWRTGKNYHTGGWKEGPGGPSLMGQSSPLAFLIIQGLLTGIVTLELRRAPRLWKVRGEENAVLFSHPLKHTHTSAQEVDF